ncbi:MAG: valine--tRNA ligase [Candidatus Kerfeldbacteria bacterium]|nr:valine--tRNA ligase [Candidatus Kerfeldbacteria bacterium]
MDKAYSPQDHEARITQAWDEKKYSNPDHLPSQNGEPHAVMMPPPNVTGVLHLGHALENSIMDTHMRYHRMTGKRTLLIPGTDHAALPTQARVENNLKKQGITNPRQEYGREKLVAMIREYAENSKSTILSQIKRLGTSCDWSRLAYTFDEERSRVVNDVFVRMFNDGLIYRGYRVVNWSIAGQSTSSDDELVYEERATTLYTFKYAKDFPIAVATVLPETKLGDTAVAVHPDDTRYQQYIGKTFTVDVGAETPRTIHVIADESVDMNYGTGALGVTSAHATADFDMYQKHPEIGIIPVIGTDGRMLPAAGKAYNGLPFKDARKKFVQWLHDNDLLIEEKEIVHNVALSDRYGDEIWPMPMEQWFVNVNKEVPGKGKTLKQLMLEAGAKITITPERFAKTYTNWITNLHDWCISRQIWWGHRIPVWYRGAEVVASAVKPAGEGWMQDADTLDTWFSSGMWTFSTLGYPSSAHVKTFHPSAWIQMGYEIIYLWMARMVLFSTYVLGEIPFREVYIHGILRDKQGRKFSKSLGNGIDPIQVIDEYGTDALRLSVLKGVAPGNDSRFYEEKVADARNFVNKLWNVARFVSQMKKDETTGPATLPDQWILTRLHDVVAEVTEAYEKNQFSQASETLYHFVWNEFADWYVEAAKIESLHARQAMNVLRTVLALLHPLTPFVTEVIAKEMGFTQEEGELMVAEWPKAEAFAVDHESTKRFAIVQELVTSIRALKTSFRIPPSTQLQVLVELGEEERALVEKLARVTLGQKQSHQHHATIVVGGVTALVILDGVVDIEAEKQRLKKEIAEVEGSLKGIQAKLNNEKFMQSAPEQVRVKTQEIHEERLVTMAKLRESLKQID